MADIQLNSVTLATETGGTVTLDNGVQDNVTRLGTVTSGTISTGATIATGVHGKYVLEDHDRFHYTSQTSTTSTSQDNINVSGNEFATMATGSSTSDLITFEMNFGGIRRSAAQTYMGVGLSRATASDFSAGGATVWRTGQHTWGGYNGAPDCYVGHVCVTKTRSVADWGLSASTTYYFRLIGQTHSTAGTYYWGQSSTNSVDQQGIKLSVFKWRLV